MITFSRIARSTRCGASGRLCVAALVVLLAGCRDDAVSTTPEVASQSPVVETQTLDPAQTRAETADSDGSQGSSREALNAGVEPADHAVPPGAAQHNPVTPAIAVEEAARATDEWDSIFVRGAKVGYTHTRIVPLAEHESASRRIEQTSVTELARGGDVTELRIEVVSHETNEGELIDFECQLALGPTPQQYRGRVEGDVLRVETETLGKATQSEIAWNEDARGFRAVEDSLRRRPMQPGERRTLRALMSPPLVHVATIELVAGELEACELTSGTFDLLRVDQIIDWGGGQTLDFQMWVDADGTILRAYVPALGEEHMRTTEELALAPNEPAKLDLLADHVIRLKQPIRAAHHTQIARYRIALADANPAEVFPVSELQYFEIVDDRALVLTVAAPDPNAEFNGKPQPTSPDDLAPSNMLQSDDPVIVELAGTVAQDTSDPWQLGIALERLVYETITEQNFSQTFASAAEVAASREGDCTEHAVLLAALARARGVPARVAVGLVYVDSFQGFGYHMWTEIHDGRRWLPLDATLGLGGIGAAHLKLADSNLAGDSAYLSFLPIAKVLGRLDIEVIEFE